MSDTMHLSTEQHGAYLLLMFAYWKNKGPLLDTRIQSICKLNGDSWTINKGVVKEFFDTALNPGKWTHHRIEKELQKASIRRQAAVDRGKKGMKSRWGDKQYHS